MYRRYYDNYGRGERFTGVGEIIVPETKDYPTYNESNVVEKKEDEIQITSCSNTSWLNSFELDDLILIGVLLFMLSDSGEKDPIILIIIGYLLLGDKLF